MDASRDFFGKLRALALTLEKEARQLEQALNREDTDYEEESPIRVLHDLHCDLQALKRDVNARLEKSCSERQEIHDFMKASKILMQRNAADLGKIRELFQKYGCKPPVFTDEEEENNCQSKVPVQNKSDQEKIDDDPHLPACMEKPPVPKDPLSNPQLSDFGLSQYAFSRTWSTMNEQHATDIHQEYPKTRTPLKTQTPSMLPKTPKCMLRMDDYECVTPKLEHFGISEHTMCMNEDYTMALIHKTTETSKNLPKEDPHEGSLAEMSPKKIMVTPGPKTNKMDGNAADYMASPAIPVFCTLGVKIPSRSDGWALPKTAETNEISLPKNDATSKLYIEEAIPSAVSSDEYLKHFEDPSPPKIKDYEHLINTPPVPEITRIPDDVLQLLSKYNQKAGSPKAKKMETKAGNTTRYESDFTNYCNKENR
ncbi:Spindle and kinetochore-associated protein 3, partial [Tinamus guttatus]